MLGKPFEGLLIRESPRPGPVLNDVESLLAWTLLHAEGRGAGPGARRVWTWSDGRFAIERLLETSGRSRRMARQFPRRDCRALMQKRTPARFRDRSRDRPARNCSQPSAFAASRTHGLRARVGPRLDPQGTVHPERGWEAGLDVPVYRYIFYRYFWISSSVTWDGWLRKTTLPSLSTRAAAGMPLTP